VRRLDEALKSRGREAWVDWADIRPAEEWMQAICGAIEGADTFIFVLTPDSVVSAVCGREIAHAAAHNKRMVPIVARDLDTNTAPEALAKLNYIWFRESDDFEKATDTLISALDTDLKWLRVHTRLLTRAAKFSKRSSKLTPLQRFMKWSVSDRRSRTISPFLQVTVSEWLEDRIKEGAVDGLRAAMQVDPSNARVTAHLGRGLADYALSKDSDPDEARRGRGEADFLTSRAVKLAPDNDEVKKLRDEVVKLLGLKTN
jgi:hypothetical protein